MIVDLSNYETRMLAMHLALERQDEYARERAERLAEYGKAWERRWAQGRIARLEGLFGTVSL